LKTIMTWRIIGVMLKYLLFLTIAYLTFSGPTVQANQCSDAARPKIFGKPVYKLAEFKGMNHISIREILDSPIFIKIPGDGVVLQRTLSEDQMPSEVVKFAYNLLTHSENLYTQDTETVRTDRLLSNGPDWGLGMNDLHYKSYETQSAIIEMADGSFKVMSTHTSNKKTMISEEDDSRPFSKLIQEIRDAVGVQKVKAIHIIHTHPNFSPLSVPDTTSGHRYFLEELEPLVSNGLVDELNLYAIAKMADHIDVPILLATENAQKATTPGKIYFMKDLENSRPFPLDDPGGL